MTCFTIRMGTWVTDEFRRNVFAIPLELDPVLQRGCGFALAVQLPTLRPCISHGDPLIAQRHLLCFQKSDLQISPQLIPCRSRHNWTAQLLTQCLHRDGYTHVGAIQTDVQKNQVLLESYLRGDEPLPRPQPLRPSAARAPAAGFGVRQRQWSRAHGRALCASQSPCSRCKRRRRTSCTYTSAPLHVLDTFAGLGSSTCR